MVHFPCRNFFHLNQLQKIYSQKSILINQLKKIFCINQLQKIFCINQSNNIFHRNQLQKLSHYLAQLNVPFHLAFWINFLNQSSHKYKGFVEYCPMQLIYSCDHATLYIDIPFSIYIDTPFSIQWRSKVKTASTCLRLRRGSICERLKLPFSLITRLL